MKIHEKTTSEGKLRRYLKPSWLVRAQVGAKRGKLKLLGELRGTKLELKDASWGLLERSWSTLGASWSALGVSWRHLGRLFGAFWSDLTVVLG